MVSPGCGSCSVACIGDPANTNFVRARRHSARIMGSRKGTYAPSESLRLSLIGVAKWVCKPNMTISEHRSGKNVAPIELPNRVDKMTSWRE
jgi:hypothetical protein